MPLLSFWKNNREEVLGLTIEQIVSNAGDGSLRDNTKCSVELREFFRICPSERLFSYARHCLAASFEKSGIVLQDIVNELGRRLDFDVENGQYQGSRTTVGVDGIWRTRDEPELLIEVKTTDYVTIPLEKLATYKEKLIAEKRLTRESSILIVVGREDTGALEAQVRGSRYAWEMRLIGVEGLIKLVQIREKSDDPVSLIQIRQILRPFEYTKVDRIIDVIFTAATDVEEQQTIEEPESEDAPHRQVRTEPELLDAKRQQAVDSFSLQQDKELVRKSRTLYASADQTFRVCCAVSKRFERGYQPYWYAFHPAWDKFLSEGRHSFFILACMDRDEAYALPYSWVEKNKLHLNMTERDDRSYWHVALTTISGDKLAIKLPKIGGKIPLQQYAFDFQKGHLG
jgi:hypothetical protein